MLLNCTRAVYSFSKPEIKTRFGLTQELVALMDAGVYLGLGVGYFMRYVLDNSLKQGFTFTLMSTLCAVSYAFIPLLSFLSTEQGIVTELTLFLCLFLYGYCQLKFLPVCLSLVNHHYTT